jgi:protein-tyrosine kinase
VGKIFDALEKFSKERGGPAADRVKDSDYEALMQFDEATGRIDMTDPKIAKDPRVLDRLKTYRLVNDDGTLTPAGRAKYDEMLHKSKDNSVAAGALKEAFPPGFERARPSDWDLLMNYDRQTGNLLKYDPRTGQLDANSRSILKDPATVQRLIDNQMILPGGWLTPEAKRECSRLEEKLEDEKYKLSARQQKAVPAQKPEPVPEPADLVTPAEMEILQDYDQETLKLNVKNPAIIKNPQIVKSFIEKDLIDAEGKLSAKALVRCRALARWKKEFEKKEPPLQKPPAEAGEKKIISLKKEKIEEKVEQKGKVKPEDKIEDRSEEKTDAKAGEAAAGMPEEKTVEKEEPKMELETAAKKEEKIVFQKVDHFVTGLEARTGLSKPDDFTSERKFTLGRPPSAYPRGEIDKELITLKSPQSFEAEQFKILRTNLLFPESGKPPRSLMVTSTAPGEGKSFVAANLAVSVARHVNWNVLLIDCDLRRPSVHRQFGYGNVPGLSDYLTNAAGLPQLMLKTSIKNLTILPAGKPPDNPSELLSSARMAELLEEVASRYQDRLIILDSPPPKLTAETGALARYVDGILLVVKYGGTPKDSVTELIAKLGRNKIIGAVVNNFDAGASRYSKKYYGGTYYTKY